MWQPSDQSHIRARNQRIILDRIFHSGRVSRADLARQLHISKSAMTENIAALLQMGIIMEVGEGKSMPTGGRKPILLQFNENYRFILAIDLNFEESVFVLFNLHGSILSHFSFPIPGNASFSSRADLLRSAIQMMLSSNEVDVQDLSLISISAPGIFSQKQKVYQFSKQFSHWQIPKLCQELERFFATKVLVVNDVNAAAVGEYRYGNGMGVQNLLYVSCGMGLGAGLILDGSLYTGRDNGAGEIATYQIPVWQKDGIVYRNLESTVHIGALLQAYQTKRGGKSATEFKDLVRLWQDGDDCMAYLIDQVGDTLGHVLGNLVTLINCDQIILGGDYLIFGSQLIPRIQEKMKGNALLPTKIVGAKLGQDAGVYGLLALSIQWILDDFCQVALSDSNGSGMIYFGSK